MKLAAESEQRPVSDTCRQKDQKRRYKYRPDPHALTDRNTKNIFQDTRDINGREKRQSKNNGDNDKSHNFVLNIFRPLAHKK